MSLKLPEKACIEDLQALFGRSFDFTGWRFDDEDSDGDVGLTELDLEIVDLIDPERGRDRVSGKDVVISLDYHRSSVILGARSFLPLMNHRDEIPFQWQETEAEEEIIWIRFYGNVLMRDGQQHVGAVLAMFYYLGQWIPDIHDLGDDVDGSEKAAVIMKWRLAESSADDREDDSQSV